MAATVVLITGASRGIGKGLVTQYLARSNYVVIAANRDPDDENSRALSALPKGHGTSLIVVKIDSSVKSDAANAMEELNAKGIDHFDLVIANAAVMLAYSKVADLDTDDLHKHAIVNNYGVIWLYQAVIPFLKKAKKPKFVGIGSSGGILTETDAAYGPTKAVLHFHCKKIHLEEAWLTAFPVDPGWVQTELGENAAKAYGAERVPTTIEESVNGLISVFDAATRETHSGKLWKFTGEEIKEW